MVVDGVGLQLCCKSNFVNGCWSTSLRTTPRGHASKQTVISLAFGAPSSTSRQNHSATLRPTEPGANLEDSATSTVRRQTWVIDWRLGAPLTQQHTPDASKIAVQNHVL
eukprot:TRINITY_DN9170_c0_g1_i3.p2 TRINITY_DN9170_c0_g1~~TRINITY_DN9170_c0_g1_i3.p2  ORF type:complete len:109 (+),score=6.55 TRINITY_DN9170_c0_g1_i3:281-607(+)